MGGSRQSPFNAHPSQRLKSPQIPPIVKSPAFALSVALLIPPCIARSAAADTPHSGPASTLIAPADIERIPAARPPVIACTPQELERLKLDYARDASADGVVASRIREASRRIRQPVEYPPRGGQHNQWYQCTACQIGLKTLDPTHHQCPRCNKVYGGAPYDDVLFAHTHRRNLDSMTESAWAYAITGEDKYAAFARDVLLGYARRYRSYEYHDSQFRTGSKASRSGGHLFEQTLNEATAMSGNIAPTCDLIRSSTLLTAEDRTAIREQLLRPMLENIAKHRAGKSNWQTWHNAAMISGGAVLGDAGWVRRAIEDPENGFLHQMKVSVSDEGMWYENSWGYHFYTLSALMSTAETARRLGVDLWSHPVLKKMFFLAVGYAMPDGSLPRFGDDVGTSLARTSRALEFAYHAYGDAALLPLLPDTPGWESVMFGRKVERIERRLLPPGSSALFPSAGHAILRTDGTAGLAAALTFGIVIPMHLGRILRRHMQAEPGE
jgi:hypothetical protein